MPGSQVTRSELKRRLDADQRRDVDSHLAQGRGVAVYGDERQRPNLIVSYGTKGADIEGRFPPSHYGRGELHSFTPPSAQPQAMRSPLKDAAMGPPQIRRPEVSPSVTAYPDVQIEMRTSGRPRRDSDGYITPLRPGREEQVPQAVSEPQAPLSPDQQWWRDHV